MSEKRPCSECRKWFIKDPRARKRQHVCGRPDCVAASNKRACVAWRIANHDKVIASRLRRKLPKHPPDPPEAVVLDPLRHFSTGVVRHVMGLKESVVISEVAKVLLFIVRHGMPPITKVRPVGSLKVLTAPVRHETADARAPQ